MPAAIVNEALRRTWMHRVAAWPPWMWMALLAATFALPILGSLLAPRIVYDGFVGPYLWRPVIYDEGFNPVNTAFLLWLAIIDVGWFTSLFRAYRQRVDPLAGIALAAVMFIGSTLRVLQDADLFAPFAESTGDASIACAPYLPGGVLDRCAAVLFITPVIWVWASLLLFLAARLALESRIIAEAKGVNHGLRHYAATLVLLVLLWLFVHRWQPDFVRVLPSPAWGVAAALAAFGLLWWRSHEGDGLNWRWGLIGYSLFPLLGVLELVRLWLIDAVPGWSSTLPQATWIAGVYVAAPTLLVASWRWKMSRLGATRKGRPGSAAAGLGWVYYLLVVEAVLIVIGVLGLRDLMEGRGDAGAWFRLALAPLGVVAGSWLLARGLSGPLRPNPLFRPLAHPFNLMMLGGQMADGFVTAIALDVLHASEKHVLPRTLVGWVQQIGLPAPLDAYPTVVVMILYKLAVVLAIAWLLDTRLAPLVPADSALIGVVKLTVFAVGFGPGTRDAVRLVMGT
jgi:uncharacterized membrane protein